MQSVKISLRKQDVPEMINDGNSRVNIFYRVLFHEFSSLGQFHRHLYQGLPYLKLVLSLDHQSDMTAELMIAFSSYRSIWRKDLL